MSRNGSTAFSVSCRGGRQALYVFIRRRGEASSWTGPRLRSRSLRRPFCADLQTGFEARARVEIIAQGIADKVETQHGKHHGQGGKQHEVRGVEQVGPAVIEHGSPTGGRRRDAESEKTHGGFGEDGPRHADRSLYHDRLNNVRQNVANDDAP